MGATRLRTIHVVIIGTFACLVVIFGLYFLIIKKANENIAALEARYQTAEAKWNQKAQVEARLLAAQQKNSIVTANYERYLREKMPPISFEDRTVGMIALWREQGETLGPMLRSWPAKTGVTLTSTVQVPAAPVDPNSINTTLIEIPIGNFTVTGDFPTILSHIRSWNKFGRLVRIDTQGISGTSPALQVQYGVTVYIFPRGEPGPQVAMAGAGQPAGFAPAAPGAGIPPAPGGGVGAAPPPTAINP